MLFNLIHQDRRETRAFYTKNRPSRAKRKAKQKAQRIARRLNRK